MIVYDIFKGNSGNKYGENSIEDILLLIGFLQLLIKYNFETKISNSRVFVFKDIIFQKLLIHKFLITNFLLESFIQSFYL